METGYLTLCRWQKKGLSKAKEIYATTDTTDLKAQLLESLKAKRVDHEVLSLLQLQALLEQVAHPDRHAVTLAIVLVNPPFILMPSPLDGSCQHRPA